MTHETPSETPEEEAARNARNAKLPPGALPEPSPADLISGVRQVAQDLVKLGITDAQGRITDANGDYRPEFRAHWDAMDAESKKAKYPQ